MQLTITIKENLASRLFMQAYHEGIGISDINTPSSFIAYKVSDNVIFGEWYQFNSLSSKMKLTSHEHYNLNEMGELFNILVSDGFKIKFY